MERAILIFGIIFLLGAAEAKEQSNLEKIRESINLNKSYDYDKNIFEPVVRPFIKKISEVQSECEELAKVSNMSGFFLGTERQNRVQAERQRNIVEAAKNQSRRLTRFRDVMNRRFDQALKDFKTSVDEAQFQREVIEYFEEQKKVANDFIGELGLRIEQRDYKTCDEQLKLLLKEAKYVN